MEGEDRRRKIEAVAASFSVTVLEYSLGDEIGHAARRLCADRGTKVGDGRHRNNLSRLILWELPASDRRRRAVGFEDCGLARRSRSPATGSQRGAAASETAFQPWP